MIFDIKCIIVTFTIMAGLVYVDHKISNVRFDLDTFSFKEIN